MWHNNKPKKRFHSDNLKFRYRAFALVLFHLNTANIRYVGTSRLRVHAHGRGLFYACYVTGHLAVTKMKSKTWMLARLFYIKIKT